MTTAGYVADEAEPHAAAVKGWNWGLIVTIGSCLVFWTVVVLGLVSLL